MVQHGGKFAFSVIEEKPHKQKVTVTIDREHIDALYNEALVAQKQRIQTFGFSKGDTPIQYVEQNFRPNILEHLKELLFTHCVVHFLYASLCNKKIVVAGDPDLVDIKLIPNGNAEFIFSLINVTVDDEQRWKRLNLKQLERKHYKDLDRQVESFVKEELDRKTTHTTNEISLGDWVNFEISLLDKEKKQLIQGYKCELWVRIQAEEDDRELHELFLGKKVGECFLTQSVFLQEYISLASDINYTFMVEIKDCLPHAYFDLELFKHQFALESEEDLPAKLVEVFSTRNDITLRREMIESLFKLLSKQYFFLFPAFLLERQRLMVLQAVQHNPDYHVYKAQPDFKEKVKALAEKQLKEAIVIDAIAYQENIKVDDQDVKAYLNLLKRPRMKDFMYFSLPEAKIQGQEVPLSVEFIKRFCLREKTLNYLLSELSKKARA